MEVTNNNVRNIRTVQGDGYMTVFSLFILQRTLRSYGSCFNYGSNLYGYSKFVQQINLAVFSK